MSNADCLIIYPSSGSIGVSRRYSSGQNSPNPYVTQNVALLSNMSSISGSTVTAVFYRPKAAALTNEQSITGSQTWIWAYSASAVGSTSNTASISQHGRSDCGTFTTNFLLASANPPVTSTTTSSNGTTTATNSTSSSTGSTTSSGSGSSGTTVSVGGSSSSSDDMYQQLIVFHGILMFLAWAVLSPFAIIVSRYFKAVLGVWWFRIHYITLSVVIIFTFFSFALAYIGIGSTTSHFNYASQGIHTVLGLALVIAAPLQGILGMVINALFNPERKGIPKHDMAHWWIGRAIIIAAMIDIIFGLRLYQNRGYDVPLWMWVIVGLVLIGAFGTYLILQLTIGVEHHVGGEIGHEAVRPESPKDDTVRRPRLADAEQPGYTRQQIHVQHSQGLYGQQEPQGYKSYSGQPGTLSSPQKSIPRPQQQQQSISRSQGQSLSRYDARYYAQD
ncbi:hypothetical protein SmJEL517_g04716 [Synchytrium microbalum]|uniref:Cytochrome b561 domain-containing protein n=1 Tax=Synchytrium microbalum TaxID=1806994 RepID=A0A507C239_9FUNG|nr:uncharacterized protein SmJEL517_g04716 [Synchytrium microbalum]TPX32154.1 hypothetical protein SmJEL517_g04716 [Synchytrium microbalum]